ncbi:MAG: hypothetical protein HY842_04980, partial [Bacteroidetes bacterium]|nr:hypothetical protein [Bacteroidota bacterium]
MSKNWGNIFPTHICQLSGTYFYFVFFTFYFFFMQVLNDRQIRQKIRRLAIEIMEHNYVEPEIILAGINNKGMAFAHLLHAELSAISRQKIILTRIQLNPANPLASDVQLEMPIE